ncbi:hypothetical protein THRCLA_22605 [Thraustotheca clavata]|uniref:Uncharacterized protein n=1 Tax=Thraustotheca clavata TaxID=74557 RepID=A0A1V9YW14_9STRA|nr:hypothetical protein THRCLA_22605 [Thraustotheca clavata]
MAEEETYELDATEAALASWIKKRLAKEVKRLKKMGADCISLSVKNMAIVREEALILNRVEVDTTMSMNTIQQIMVAEERQNVPDKEGYLYVNVVLLAQPTSNEQIAYLMPYVYDANILSNDLTQWVFINNEFERSQHAISAFT